MAGGSDGVHAADAAAEGVSEPEKSASDLASKARLISAHRQSIHLAARTLSIGVRLLEAVRRGAAAARQSGDESEPPLCGMESMSFDRDAKE